MRYSQHQCAGLWIAVARPPISEQVRSRKRPSGARFRNSRAHSLDDSAEDSGRCPHRDAHVSSPVGAELGPRSQRHSTTLSENIHRLILEPKASTVEPSEVG